MHHSHFDTRGYPILDPAEGYSQWAPTYEDTVPDELDIRLLGRLQSVDWNSHTNILDIACGTGRIANWLSQHTNAPVTGIDITPGMLDVARQRNIYHSLHEGDAIALPFDDASFDLSIMSLADEHIEDLAPVYAEAARVTKPRGSFILVGYHPHFLMLGIPTHFRDGHGNSTSIESYVHQLSDHTTAALNAGWRLQEMREGIIDDVWIARKPKWEQYRHHPVSFVLTWAKS
ncbi:MAG: class I SAM-dependent DNA methyltransferase [Phycisphaerales bacterium JB043]